MSDLKEDSIKMFFGIYYAIKVEIPEYSGIYQNIMNEGYMSIA